jgi:hypothetical protein
LEIVDYKVTLAYSTTIAALAWTARTLSAGFLVEVVVQIAFSLESFARATVNAAPMTSISWFALTEYVDHSPLMPMPVQDGMAFASTTLTVVERSLTVAYFAPRTILVNEKQSMVVIRLLAVTALRTTIAVDRTCSAPQTNGAQESTQGQVIEAGTNIDSKLGQQ